MSQIDKWYDILKVFVAYGKIEETELKDIVQISTPTLRKNINQLNEQLVDIAWIHKEGAVYTLDIQDFDSFSIILDGQLKQAVDFNSSTKRTAYILKELIETNDYLLIDDLAEELGVSRGTASRDLKEVKEIVETFGVGMIGTPNKGMKIEGEEFELRLIYLYYVHDYFPTTFYIGDINPYIEAYALEKNIPEGSVNTWKKVLEITLKRILSKRHLLKAIPHYTNYQLDDDKFDQLIYEIESLYHITLSQYDIDFISFPLNISNTGAVEKMYMNEAFVRDIFDRMLHHIYQVTSVEFDGDELYDEMRFHLLYLLNRLIFRMENYDYFYGEIENKYPLAYEIAKVGIDEIERLVGRTSSEAEISYLAVYFELMMKKKDKTSREIAIVCNTGKGTAALIKQQIKQVLGDNIRLATYTEDEYHETDLSDYFAVFTTIPLENVNAKTPLIRITNLFNDEWLHSEWQRVKKVNELNFHHVDFHFSKVVPDVSYKSQLTRMIEPMVDKQVVDGDFLKRIFNREEQQTTVFSNGIAFPHAINLQSHRIIFHLGVLEDVISLNQSDITYIFMVGIPQNMNDVVEAELLQLYDYMLKILSDDTKKQELSRLTDSEQFYQWLWKEVF